MRLARLALALAVTLVACGGSAPPASSPAADEDDGPFVDNRDFEPTAFTVKVTGHGTPVIFIPGVACPGSVWDDTVERLGDDIQAHVITLAGFAGEKPTRPPLLAKARRDLVRYIRSRRLENPIVVGHSLGGFLAYWLAATAPDAIGGLVVVDAGPRYCASDATARLLRNTWAQAGDDELPRQVRAKFSGMARHRERLEPYIDQIARSDRQTVGDAVYELVKVDLTEQIASITAPVLLVLADGGLKDRSRRQAQGIDDLEIVVMPKTGHFVMFDDPEGFVRVLRDFIDAHSD